MMGRHLDLSVTFLMMFCTFGSIKTRDSVLYDASNLQLVYVPTDIPDNVTDLRLDHNSLTEILAGVFVRLPKLTNTNLSHNAITTVDSQALMGTVVKHLDLLSNKLSVVPHLSHSHLTHLILKKNTIRRVRQDSFKDLPSLEYINLATNRIAYVHPEAFCGTQLQWVRLGFNALLKVPEFRCLSRTLKILYLAGNKISRVRDIDFRGLKVLEVLELNRNKIYHVSGLDTNLGSSLEILRIRSNRLQTFDVWWSRFKSLGTIQARGNKLQCFQMVSDM